MQRPAPNRPGLPAADERWQRARTGAVALMSGRVVAAICGFVQLPIVFRALGAEGLGLWITLTGWLWSSTLLDFGVGYAVQNRVTRLLAEGKAADAAAVARRGLRAMAGVAIAVLAFGLPVAFFGRWGVWFGVQNPSLAAGLPAAVAFVIGAAALIVPLSLATRIATALQATWITGGWTMVASLLGLGGVIAAKRLGLPLLGFIAAGTILPVLPHAMTWLHVGSRLRPRGRATSTGERASSLWRESALFLMPQIGAALLGTLVPTLVTLFAGAIAAATFGVLQRLYGFALQIQATGLTPTWPAYTHAAAVGDGAFARRTFRTTWILTISAFIVPTLLLTPEVPRVVKLWLGASAPAIPHSLLWAVTALYLLQYCGQPIAMLLNGLGRLETLVLAGWAGIAIMLGLSFVLGPTFGAVGIALALIVPYVGLNLPMTAWQAHRALRDLDLAQRVSP